MDTITSIADFVAQRIALQPSKSELILPSNNELIIAPPALKAASLHAPWGYAIALGLKDEEYRTRRYAHRGWTLLHVTKSKKSDNFLDDYYLRGRIEIHRSAFIGATWIESCDGESGNWTYHCRRSFLFPEPIMGVKGQQSVFWGSLPDSEQAFADGWRYINSYVDFRGESLS